MSELRDPEPMSDSDGEGEEDLLWNLGFVEPPRRRADLFRHRFPSKVGGAPAWLDPLNLPGQDQLSCDGERLRFLLQVGGTSLRGWGMHPAWGGRRRAVLATVVSEGRGALRDPPQDADHGWAPSQVYAALEDGPPEAFHRSIFVFVHGKGKEITKPGGVRALRCQLPLSNPFYPPHPAGPKDVLPPPLAAADEAAAASRDPWRCSERETRLRAVEASARAALETSDERGAVGDRPGVLPGGAESSPASATALPGASTSGAAGVRGSDSPPETFPEFELVVEPEPEEDEEAAVQAIREVEQRRLADLAAGRAAGAEDEDDAAVVAEVESGITREQVDFATFQARVAAAPDQVLRYCTDRGARPLCPSSQGVPSPGDAPPCSRCGAPRRFEFQVLPQLLNHLGQDATDPQALDWATLAIYTCSASCPPDASGSAYADEFVWVQPPLG